jgi:hypothetical protein
MVEDYAAELHVVVASPPSVFDAAVIARTLYTGLGTAGWTLYVTGLGRRFPVRLLTESRLPAAVARERIILDRLPETRGRVYVVDPRGRPAWSLEEEPSVLLVDYAGLLRRALDAEPVSGAGFPSLTYEAATVIYEFFIRRRVPPPPSGERAHSEDPRTGAYLARKLLEALTVFDNYVVLEPSVVVYTLRRLYTSRGLILDPAGYRFDIDPVTGGIREEIEMRLYDKRLRPRGNVVAVFDGVVFRLMEDGRETYAVEIDSARGVACLAPGFCVGEAAGDASEGVGAFAQSGQGQA